MTPRPGKVTVRSDLGTLTVEMDPARDLVLTIDGPPVCLHNPDAVDALARHLTKCAAWMRQPITAAQAADSFEEIVRRFRDIATKGAGK